MATAAKDLFSDAQDAVRTGESAGHTHQGRPQKLPPQRTESSLAPYAGRGSGTVSQQSPYPTHPENEEPLTEQEVIRLQLIEIMCVDAKGLERAEIAEAIGVSQPTLDSWLAKTRLDRMMPVTALPGWCKATGSTAVLEWVAGELGYELAGPERVRDAELGKLVRQARGLIEEVLTG